jgi:hypothetical protein
MPGGHPNARHAADTRADPIVAYMVEHQYLGTDESLDIALPTHDAANEGRLAFNRSARRQNLSPAAWVADEAGERCTTQCASPGSPHYLRLKLWAKDAARTHIFRATGGDPAGLKYNPWQRKTKRYSDSGQL